MTTETTDTNNQEITSTSEENGQIETSANAPADANIRHRVSLRHEVYTELKAEAKRQGKPLVQLATEIIESYLQTAKGEG